METLSTNNQNRRFLQIFTNGTMLAKLFMAVLIVCTNCISANAQDWHELYKKGQEYEKKSMTVKAMTCYEEALKELEYLRMENEVLKKYHALLRQKGLLKENKQQ